MYYPLNDGLFEIKFVEHQNPFYQLGKLYVYKLKLELFQYSSERIETDLDEINKFALDIAFNVVNVDDTTPLEEKQASPDTRANMSNRDFEEEASIIVNNTEPNIFGN
jgi:Virus neck protein